MSAILDAAIKLQLETRAKRNAAGQLLCRRCGKVVPAEYSIVFWNPEDETHVWGPCCSDECICHLKICSCCNKDFIIDKEGDITHVGDGTWLCHDCIKTVKLCKCCNRKTTLRDSPSGEICEDCYRKMYFTCTICSKEHKREKSINTSIPRNELVKWTHALNIEKPTCLTCYKKAIKGKQPLPISVCGCCGDSFPITPSSRSEEYCDRCIERKDVRVCSHCNKYVRRWDVLGDKIYCTHCRTLVTPCECCRKTYIPKVGGFKFKGTLKTYRICEACSKKADVSECASCMSLSSKIYKVAGKKDACGHCFPRYNHCPNCDQFHFQESFCRNEESKGRFRVSEYSYKPTLFFNYIKKASVFFGFENEINYTDDKFEDALRLLYTNYPASTLYAKRDGSISGQGFEIVTHPMTLEFFDSMDLGPMYQTAPRANDTSCGLHVHVSRSSFEGQAHLYKFTEFINSNSTFMKKIAGRDFNSYAKQYKEKITKAIKGTASRERYHAVNLTNPHTVEVRIFKSARTEHQLRYRIEFVHALVAYTRDCSMMAITVDGFKTWLATTDSYPNLKKELSK